MGADPIERARRWPAALTSRPSLSARTPRRTGWPAGSRGRCCRPVIVVCSWRTSSPLAARRSGRWRRSGTRATTSAACSRFAICLAGGDEGDPRGRGRRRPVRGADDDRRRLSGASRPLSGHPGRFLANRARRQLVCGDSGRTFRLDSPSTDTGNGLRPAAPRTSLSDPARPDPPATGRGAQKSAADGRQRRADWGGLMRGLGLPTDP